MSAIDLLQPLLEGGVRRNNFFNGRLLSAEDLRTEQEATRGQLRDHGRAFGEGIAWGFDVSIVAQGPAEPTVCIAPGLGFNRLGHALRLQDPAQVRLVAAQVATEVLSGLFADCAKPRPSATFAGAGVWVLAASPVSGYRESAIVSDPNATALGRGACGARYEVEGLSFRLAQVAIDESHGLVPQGIDPDGTLEASLRTRLRALLAATPVRERELLRNVLAHACYGSGTLARAFADPQRRYSDAGRELVDAPVWMRWGLLDAMREHGDLTDCDLPLALVVLDGDGIRLLDPWSVRRRPVDANAVDAWRFAAGGRRAAEGEAAFLQFQSQLEVVRAVAPTPATLAAADWFDWLPAAGWLPVAGTRALDWKKFLGNHAPAAETRVDAALLRGIVERSWHEEPVRLQDLPRAALRVYRVPGEGFVVFARSPAAQLRLVFTPAPTTAQGLTATVEPRTGATVKSNVQDAGVMVIPDLAPGQPSLTVESSAFQTVTQQVDLVGGRITELAIALQAVPGGAMLVTAADKSTGTMIGTVSDEIVAVGPGSSGASKAGTRQANGKWLVGGLVAGTYTVRGTISGYKPASQAGVAVGASGQATVTIDFERSATAPVQPERCIAISSLPKLKYRNLRLCMVTADAVFARGEFTGRKAIETARVTAPAVMFSVHPRTSKRTGFTIGGSGELLYEDHQPPWATMVRVQPEPAALTAWLVAWRDWLAVVFGTTSIGAAAPALFIDPKFKPPATEQSVRETPPAYAVFGVMALPVSIGVSELSTKGPVLIRDAGIKGIPEEDYEKLDLYDIRTINDIVWIWDMVVQDITGDPAHVVDLTIAEAKELVPDINDQRGYYAGMDAQTNAALKEKGFATDESIARAGIGELTDAVGNEAFAHRLQKQAKAIVGR